jgi:hypothetical protein
MPRPTAVDKPSEPLGVSFTLDQLQHVVARAIAVYGPDAAIYGYNGLNGIALHVHFPSGVDPHVTFTEVT